MNNPSLTRIFIFCLFNVLIISCVLSQTTFNKTFDFSNGDESAFSVIALNDGYILIGSGWGYEIGDYFDFKLKYEKLDLEGNVMWQKVFGVADTNLFIYPESGHLTQDGNILFCGSRQTATTSEIHLVKFDPSNGDTIFYKRFAFDDAIYGLQVHELSDGSLITLGWDSNDSFASILLKTTSAGEFIWEHRYGSTNEDHPTTFDISDEDSIYLINSNLNCSPDGYYIRTIDSDGDISTSTFFADDCVANGIKSVVDGYYGGGAYYPVPPYQTFIYRMNNDGNVLWHYETSFDMDTLEYGQLFPEIVKELPNGDLLVSGYFSSNYLGSYHGLVSKINLEGTAYWERIYTATTDFYDDNIIYDIDVAPDGGIILVGSAFSDYPTEDQNFWALKLDSVGCLIPGCDTLDTEIFELPFDKTGMVIFPNPLEDEAIIQIITDSNNEMKNLKLEITDLLGKVLMSSEISYESAHYSGKKINIPFQRNNLPAGVYLFTIYSNNVYLKSKKAIFK